MLGLSESHQDSLGQRIAATVVVVDAVVGDLLSNLTANRAQDYHGPCHTEQAQFGALCHLLHCLIKAECKEKGGSHC